MKITKSQLLNIIQESVMRNLKEASEEVTSETVDDSESLAKAFNNALNGDSAFELDYNSNPCCVEVTFKNESGYAAKKVRYILGGDSFTVFTPDNSKIGVTKVAIGAYHRGYMIRLIVDAGIFSLEEIGQALTTRG